VASNTPKSVVLQVCNSDALAASVSVRELIASQLEQRLHQLGLTPHDLNDFLAELFAASVPNWQTTRTSS
jgi:predicted RNA-binding Zn ribbon-like protein